MSIIIGIDLGISTTKIVGFKKDIFLKPLQVKSERISSAIYSALISNINEFLKINHITISEVSKIALTGVGASYISGDILDVPTTKVDEFMANSMGGRYFANKEDILVVSMGTGTSYVKMKGNNATYIGGLGMGGGTLIGLSNVILNTDDIHEIIDLANNGNSSNVDLIISDITDKIIPGLPSDVTASAFAKIKNGDTNNISREDLAAGIVRLILENIMQTAVLISKGYMDCRFDDYEIVLIGSLTALEACKNISNLIKTINPVKFIIPENGAFATAIGAVKLI